MALMSDIYDRVSDVVGPDAVGIAVVVAIALACYFIIGAGRPST
jgi:hypothetical protein